MFFNALVPKLQLGNVVVEALASPPRSQAGAWERADTGNTKPNN